LSSVQNTYSLPHEADDGQVDSPRLILTWELIAYVAIGVLALVLYTAALGSVALNETEARGALAAWRFIDPAAPGADFTPPSPLVFLAQSASFALLGGGEASARIVTALAGVALVLSPALFRRALGGARALLMSALLLGSPVVMITARGSSPMLWAALLAALTLWAGWRYEVTRATQADPSLSELMTAPRSSAWAAALLTLFALLVLTDVGGVILGLTLALAAVIARLTAPTPNDDLLDVTTRERLSVRLSRFPWATAAPIAAVAVVALATLFMLYPQGLGAVGDVLVRTVGGAAVRPEAQSPAFALLISLFYELWLWLLAGAVLIWMVQAYRPAVTFVDRFALAWLLLGMVAAGFYGSTTADHALWLTLPLVILVSRLGLVIFAREDDAPSWAVGLAALAGVGLLAMGSLSFQGFARSVTRFAYGEFSITQLDALYVVVLIIVVIFAIVGYFLIRSFWEQASIPLKGAAIALIAYAIITGIGSGWGTAVRDAGNPHDFWQRNAASPDALLLRETLFEVAELTSKGYAEMPLTVISGGDPLVEWAVRDFNNARFVNSYDEVDSAPVILALAQTDADRAPALAAAYLGQEFTIERRWALSNLLPSDIMAWWTQRRVVTPVETQTQAILWVRSDIYAGTTSVGG
jgi:hypothetical protein